MEQLLGLTLAGNVLANVLASGLSGRSIAVRAGRPGVQGALIGGLLPWLGLLIVMAIGGRDLGRSAATPAKRGIGLFGVVLMCLGAALVLIASFGEWAKVGGSALQFRQSLSVSGAISPQLVTTSALISALFVALAVGAWRHGGLRFCLVAAFLTTTAAALFVDVMIVATLLAELARTSAEASQGNVRVSLLIGSGAWMSMAGCVVAYVGSLFLLMRNPVPRPTAPALIAPAFAAPQAAATPPAPSPQGGTSWGTDSSSTWGNNTAGGAWGNSSAPNLNDGW